MSTDRELVEMAAKASGREGDWVDFAGMDIRVGYQGGMLCGDADGYYWNPLKDDGDALQLAVDLKLSVKHGVDIWDDTNRMSAYAYYRDVGECEFEPHGGDPYAATRRAIVRAAAKIGRAVP